MPLSSFETAQKERKITLFENENSFTQYDRLRAQEAFSLWQAEQNCDIDEYLFRQRQQELERLVRKVIKNELDERDQLIVSLYWYKGKTKDEIAKIVGSDRSTIFRRFDKINNIVYEKLKYAIEYRYGDGFADKTILLVKRDVSSKYSIRGLESIGERLSRLREEQYLSKQEVSKLVGIDQKRLSLLEKSGKELTMIELKRLASFYHVTSDYIIFGKDRILRDRDTGKPTLVAV